MFLHRLGAGAAAASGPLPVELVEQMVITATVISATAIDFTAAHAEGDTVVVIAFSDQASTPSMVQSGWTTEASADDVVVYSRVLGASDDPADYDLRNNNFPGSTIGFCYLLRNVTALDATAVTGTNSLSLSRPALSADGFGLGAVSRPNSSSYPTISAAYNDLSQNVASPAVAARGGSAAVASGSGPSFTAGDGGPIGAFPLRGALVSVQ